jgi:DNA (cytosine-5)-methyltransferase 1
MNPGESSSMFESGCGNARPQMRLAIAAGKTDGSTVETTTPVENFAPSEDRRSVIRRVRDRQGVVHESRLPLSIPFRSKQTTQGELACVSDYAYLRLNEWPETESSRSPVRIADVFCGGGLMTLGVWEACRALRRKIEPVLAIDVDREALGVYDVNFPGAHTLADSVSEYIDAELGNELSVAERCLSDKLGVVELVVGGPPCQGHSDLNNHTRRRDPKNGLYDRMARFAEVVLPEHLIIENVPAVLHDAGDVLGRTKTSLINVGYDIDDCVVELSSIGVPQNRRRHVLVASRTRTPNIRAVITRHMTTSRDVRWAIDDLASIRSESIFDKPAKPTARMQKRIEYLFENDLYDLPNSQRPACHKAKPHSYKSVYGRLEWDLPAQTITSGFGCMGQGRFVHPQQPRTLTPHEAARLQFIPDFFRFGDKAGRTATAQMIANAVPPKLVYLLALDLLS